MRGLKYEAPRTVITRSIRSKTCLNVAFITHYYEYLRIKAYRFVPIAPTPSTRCIYPGRCHIATWQVRMNHHLGQPEYTGPERPAERLPSHRNSPLLPA